MRLLTIEQRANRATKRINRIVAKKYPLLGKNGDFVPAATPLVPHPLSLLFSVTTIPNQLHSSMASMYYSKFGAIRM